MNTGDTAQESKNGLLTTVAYKLSEDSPPMYALEGSVAYCGALIQWLRDNLGIINTTQESEALAMTVKDNGGVYFVPAFAGLHAPYWDVNARGCIVGLTAFNSRAHIARAALEAASFQTNEVINAMRMDSGVALRSLKVDGGMTHNSIAMQFQSDILGVPLMRPSTAETTALGAAFAAGLAVNIWTSVAELKATWKASATWQPDMPSDTRKYMIGKWHKAVCCSKGWADETPSDSTWFSPVVKGLVFGIVFGMCLHRGLN
jgi:glycerol kinase